MKSYIAHYRNKWPGGRVVSGEGSLDVYGADDDLKVALRVDGNGQTRDVGAEIGASDVHDLEPIPKNARVWKYFADGKIGKSEEYEERKKAAADLAVDGKILSIAQYKKLGFRVDSEGNVFAAEAK